MVGQLVNRCVGRVLSASFRLFSSLMFGVSYLTGRSAETSFRLIVYTFKQINQFEDDDNDNDDDEIIMLIYASTQYIDLRVNDMPTFFQTFQAFHEP